MGRIDNYDNLNKAKALSAYQQFPPAMDYSYYAAANQQPYQFLGLPPTPSHTNAGISGDEFSNGSPPVSILGWVTQRPDQTNSDPGRARPVPELRYLQQLRHKRNPSSSYPAISTPTLRPYLNRWPR